MPQPGFEIDIFEVGGHSATQGSTSSCLQRRQPPCRQFGSVASLTTSGRFTTPQTSPPLSGQKMNERMSSTYAKGTQVGQLALLDIPEARDFSLCNTPCLITFLEFFGRSEGPGPKPVRRGHPFFRDGYFRYSYKKNSSTTGLSTTSCTFYGTLAGPSWPERG